MVIDFRVRPVFKGFLDLGIVKAWRNVPTDPRAMRPTGFERRPVPSVEAGDVDMMVKEMDEAGVVHGVLMGRQTMHPAYGGVKNEDIRELMELYPGRFSGFAGVCAHDPHALEEVERCVRDWGFKGVTLDPGWSNPPIYAHDKRIFPIIDLCGQLGVPVSFAMSAYTGPDLSYCDPTLMGPVLKKFPGVKFIFCHGCWPKVQEVLGVAATCPNLYIVPDCYFYVRNMPFADQFVRAANSFMRYRTLFGTGYPIRGFAQTVEDWSSRGLEPEPLRLTLYENAARLLGLS